MLLPVKTDDVLMKKRCSTTLGLLVLMTFVAPIGAQYNTVADSDLPGNFQGEERYLQVAGTKSLTNERVVSLVKVGIGDGEIISLISQFPSGLNASLEALMKLHDAGVSNAVINAIKSHSPDSPAKKLERSKTLADLSAVDLARLKEAGVGNAEFAAEKPNIQAVVPSENLSVVTQKDKISIKKTHLAPGNWALGLVYPGAAIRYQTGGKSAWEIKAQSGSGVLVVGPRFYYYLGSVSGLSLFCGAEADYIGFKGKVSRGSGFAGGAFIGGELSLSRQLRLSMDFGPMYMSLRETKFSESVSGMDYIINMGIYWHFK